MKKLYVGIASLPFTLFLFLLPFSLLSTNFTFYTFLFKYSGTYTYFENSVIPQQRAQEIIQYLQGKVTTLDPTFFSNQAILHMQDVQQLFSFLKLLFLTSILLITMTTIVLLIKKSMKSLSYIFLTTGISTMIIPFCILFLSLFSWNTSFTFFHKLFFSNNYWLFSSSDTLVQLFPISFFVLMTISLCLTTFLLALLILVLGYFLYKEKKFYYTN